MEALLLDRLETENHAPVQIGCDTGSIAAALAKITDFGKHITLDCRLADFATSEDLRRLVTMHLKLAADGGRIRLVNVKPRIFEVLRITRLDRMFAIDGLEAA